MKKLLVVVMWAIIFMLAINFGFVTHRKVPEPYDPIPRLPNAVIELPMGEIKDSGERLSNDDLGVAAFCALATLGALGGEHSSPYYQRIIYDVSTILATRLNVTTYDATVLIEQAANDRGALDPVTGVPEICAKRGWYFPDQLEIFTGHRRIADR